MTQKIIEAVRRNKIIAIVRGLNPEYIPGLAQALYDGGIRMIEVTFDQKHSETWVNTVHAIQTISETFADLMYVGAGTVISSEQLKMAYEAGARFIISPSVNTELIRQTKAYGMASFPGAMTPSEAVAAHEAGADIIKLFPAASLGTGYLKAIRAPLSHLEFMAVGGINEKNVVEYLNAGACGLGIGGNLVNLEWIETGRFDLIEELARKYVEAVK